MTNPLPRFIILKYRDYCRKCGKATPKGSSVLWDTQTKDIYHKECYFEMKKETKE